MDLVAASEEEGRRWVQGFKKLRKKAETMSQQEKIHHWIHEYLRKADKNKDNKMSFKEIKNLLKMINIEADDEYAFQLFKNKINNAQWTKASIHFRPKYTECGQDQWPIPAI
ncbi:hypothetical protein scyTo_0022532 [Scyliorhinus torazame]|uniref:EF-hand domain-containing protein n=1 Tax=Scyliorhinus torazame TaxID=75743 RepID=A0A401Q877_SCYTO|nr:hypothetical protein [Scyliorhinus torazame]